MDAPDSGQPQGPQQPAVISAEQLKGYMSGTLASDLEDSLLEQFIVEGEARVRRETGVTALPAGDPEVFGIVRDLALARVYEVAFAAQGSGDVPIAVSLRTDARKRLADLDLLRAILGEQADAIGGAGGGSGQFGRPVKGASGVSNLDGPDRVNDPRGLWSPEDVLGGYRSDPARHGRF